MTPLTRRLAPINGAGVAVGAVGELDHINATIIPFRVWGTPARRTPDLRHPARPKNVPQRFFVPSTVASRLTLRCWSETIFSRSAFRLAR